MIKNQCFGKMNNEWQREDGVWKRQKYCFVSAAVKWAFAFCVNKVCLVLSLFLLSIYFALCNACFWKKRLVLRFGASKMLSSLLSSLLQMARACSLYPSFSSLLSLFLWSLIIEITHSYFYLLLFTSIFLDPQK